MEIDGEVVSSFVANLRPHPKAKIDPQALFVTKKTEEEIMQYEDWKSVYSKFHKWLSQYVNRYDTKDKIFLVGYNNAAFDNQFLRKWFELCEDKFFGSFFWGNGLDVMVQATEYLAERRVRMPNFKLNTVAQTVGIEVNQDELHDALYDVLLTRQIYNIVTGKDIEL